MMCAASSCRFHSLCTAQQERIESLELELEAPALPGYRKPAPKGETFTERILRTEAEYQRIIKNVFNRKKDGIALLKSHFLQWHRHFLARCESALVPGGYKSRNPKP